MWFDSLDAVKAFMGDDYDVAHVPAEAQAMLARGLLQAGHLRPGITAEQAADIMGLQLAGTLRTARHPPPLARRALRPARRPSPDRRPAPRPAAIRFRKR